MQNFISPKSMEVFEEMFSLKENPQVAFCPYRICPMGAHSDHQYGKITGLAIDKGITVTYAPDESGLVTLRSLNFSEPKSFSLNKIPPKQNDWADYLRGAAAALKKRFDLPIGIKGVIEGSLPIGGLSSSAAVILSFLTALLRVNGINLSAEELIDVALESEVSYVGVNVGRLDQSCEVYCKKDNLLYLDTLNGQYELIPQPENMKPYEIAIFFSGIERTLAGSKFNMRVDELKSAAYALMAFSGMEYGKFEEARLRHVPREIYEQYKSRLPENWAKRAEHFYTEFERVEKGAEAWRKGDIEGFGRLSFESGYSSIYNYETGSDELKTLYDIMRDTDGIYGGRFSGAGFKGCCMAIIDPAYKDSVLEKVEREYLKAFPELNGKYSSCICRSADGLL